uniref:histidine kinase n=1 Tax=Hemiselmis andersenii TaxID=464988 RepID=A0A7S0TX79_HEMAN|mmetsp:Transcript_25038/g.57818  ORF Transcript_25038/g.57818 Transcript_25038/m.57818 type:complete len:1469 (+) Transcript_25038:185-4591(+)|eukprot:CAMPEP_0114112304 /NCGR_PEP_ID=MMETSP0043_2-20121206/2318_1 /TAXON_ID=464988 /ORGANISM="Hemiselmis andersenii, Strain CCMP644" /LENGTH=1468 /DNA_ID=CAMNT_0001204399 /DNA_START=144 /DNA_END=4550 /DNA_ORIENTATION=-
MATRNTPPKVQTSKEPVGPWMKRAWSTADLAALDPVDLPIWLMNFEPTNVRFVWANQSAVTAWCKDSLEEFLAQDLNTNSSHAVIEQHNFLHQKIQVDLQTWSGPKTIYPKKSNVPIQTLCEVVPMRYIDDSGKEAVVACITAHKAEKGGDSQDTVEMLRSQHMMTHCMALMFLVDTSGKVLYCNGAAAAFYMFKPDEGTMDHFVQSCVWEGDGDKTQFVHAILSLRQGDSNEVFEAKKHGSKYLDDGQSISRWHKVQAIPHKDIHSGEDVILITETDISEQKHLSNKLFIAQQSQESFFSSILVSHELRTPLNGIIGLTEILLSDESCPRHVKETLEVIRKSGTRLAGLVSDILDVAALRESKLKLCKEAVCVADVVQCVCDTMRSLVREGVQLVNNVKDTRMVDGDSGRIAQVFSNLIGNAIKFTPSGTIQIDGTFTEGSYTIEVSDTGNGIPAEHREFIFLPFTQADAEASRLYGGTGLGLGLAKSLVESHQGTIQIYSQTPEETAAGGQRAMGTGTTVTVTMPTEVSDIRFGSFASETFTRAESSCSTATDDSTSSFGIMKKSGLLSTPVRRSSISEIATFGSLQSPDGHASLTDEAAKELRMYKSQYEACNKQVEILQARLKEEKKKRRMGSSLFENLRITGGTGFKGLAESTLAAAPRGIEDVVSSGSVRRTASEDPYLEDLTLASPHEQFARSGSAWSSRGGSSHRPSGGPKAEETTVDVDESKVPPSPLSKISSGKSLYDENGMFKRVGSTGSFTNKCGREARKQLGIYEQFLSGSESEGISIPLPGISNDTITILTVDDEEVNNLVITGILAPEGYKVESASNGRDAIEFVRQSEKQPHIVLLDVMMPVMTGLEVCRVLRREFPTLAIVMCSAKGSRDDIVRGFEAGANDYVTKPVERHELRARIRALLHSQQLWMYRVSAMASESLLKRMLPANVIQRLKDRKDKRAIVDHHECVTVLFSDIVGFTNMCEEAPLEGVIEMLNDLFNMFDSLCDLHGIVKCEVIGDGYMCVSGHLPNTHDHAQRMVAMALDMIEATRHIQSPMTPGESVRIRIGINSGPLISGVVGEKVPKWSLFGDTVNTASRMESHGMPMNVFVSKSTRDILKHTNYEFLTVPRRKIKGKGEMETFAVKGTGLDIHLVESLILGLEQELEMSSESFRAASLAESRWSPLGRNSGKPPHSNRRASDIGPSPRTDDTFRSTSVSPLRPPRGGLRNVHSPSESVGSFRIHRKIFRSKSPERSQGRDREDARGFGRSDSYSAGERDREQTKRCSTMPRRKSQPTCPPEGNWSSTMPLSALSAPASHHNGAAESNAGSDSPSVTVSKGSPSGEYGLAGGSDAAVRQCVEAMGNAALLQVRTRRLERQVRKEREAADAAHREVDDLTDQLDEACCIVFLLYADYVATQRNAALQRSVDHSFRRISSEMSDESTSKGQSGLSPADAIRLENWLAKMNVPTNIFE